MRAHRRVLILLIACVIAAQTYVRTLGAGEDRKGSAVARQESAGIGRITYEWSDPNTAKMIGWQGDTRVVDPRVVPLRFTYVAEVHLDRLRLAIESFGVPDDQMRFTYAGAADRRQKELQQKQRLEAGGMTIDESGNVVRVSYEWVVNTSRDDLKTTAAGLMNLGAANNYTGAREMLHLFSSFVQSLEYRIPSQYRQNAKGERVFAGGITMPLETLYNGWGDCDTKCLLFASLLANIPKTSAVFLVGNRHIFVGIRGTPKDHDQYISIKGIPYILAELTGAWPLGRIPNSTWMALGQNQFRIYPIYASE